MARRPATRGVEGPARAVHASPAPATQLLASLRLPAKLIARADALIPKLEEIAEISVLGKMTRSKVLRLALMRGLTQLEHTYSASPVKK